MIIIHADIRTMAGACHPDGFLQIREGKIQALGSMEHCPADSEILDAGGRIAFPGLVDAHCHLGMWEDGLGFEGDDGNEDTDPCTPHLRALDAVNPFDRSFSEALDYGVTSVVTGPGSSNPIAGQICALKTDGVRVDDMLLRAPLAIKFAMGENPKNSYHQKEQGPVTRMGIAALIREQLAKARRYAEQLAEAEEDEDEEISPPDYDAKCEALLPLLRREIPAHFHAHRPDDIFTAIRIAKEFSLDYVIVHGTGGHLVAKELAAEGARVIAGPLFCARTKPELAGSLVEGPGILYRAGVRTAISSDHPELPCHYLLLSAQMAMQAGLEEQAALRAITIEAAKICGLEKQIGSLEPGKDADILLFDEEPSLTRRKPWAVFLNGRRVRG